MDAEGLSSLVEMGLTDQGGTVVVVVVVEETRVMPVCMARCQCRVFRVTTELWGQSRLHTAALGARQRSRS